MNPKAKAFLLGVLTLGACGGGSPYIGLWQCESDPESSLEIARFEDYFLITARHGEKETVREGIYENDAFSVGSNSVGQAMSLKLIEGQLVCSNPPNFCRCDAAFDSVESLAIRSRPVSSDAGAKESPPSSAPDFSPTTKQILRRREPLSLQLDNGGTILLFDHYRNEDLEQRMFDWPKLAYFYLPQLTLAELPGGGYAVLREREGEYDVVFNLFVRRFDRFELMERVHDSINTKIPVDHVVPLAREKTVVELTSDSSARHSISETPVEITVGELTEISLRSPGENKQASRTTGEAIVAAINQGSMLPRVWIEIMQTGAAGDTSEPHLERVFVNWPVVAGP